MLFGGVEATKVKKHVAVCDLETGFLLYQVGSLDARAPASTIKVLSAITAYHHNPKGLNKYVTITKRAASQPPTRAGIQSGEQYRIIDLIKACLISSSNDAAYALAEGVAGSMSKFVRLMNQQAKSLGARHTQVTNPSGLPKPGGMLTNCRDNLLVIRECAKIKVLADLLKQSKTVIKSRKGRQIHLHNHNRVLRNKPYAIWGKTGYTKKARHCFLAFATHQGRSIGVCILGTTSRKSLWKDTLAAFEKGFRRSRSYLPHYMKNQGLTVNELYNALKKAGIRSKTAESHYGLLTKNLVKAYQKKRGLLIDGIAGRQTWENLNRE